LKVFVRRRRQLITLQKQETNMKPRKQPAIVTPFDVPDDRREGVVKPEE